MKATIKPEPTQTPGQPRYVVRLEDRQAITLQQHSSARSYLSDRGFSHQDGDATQGLVERWAR